MKIGILSDIHELNWINHTSYDLKINYLDNLIMNIIFHNVNPSSFDIFVIAGDIGESPSRIIHFLNRFQELTKIENIIFVPGNHEHFSIFGTNKVMGSPIQYGSAEAVKNDITTLIRDRNIEEAFFKFEKDPLGKVDLLIDYINKNISNVFATNNGETFEINGIKIAGTCGWYDGMYMHERYTKTYGDINFNSSIFQDKLKKIYKSDLDSKLVESNPGNLWYSHYKNIVEKLDNDLDMIITHINPMIEHIGINEYYHNNDENSFFSFDGLKYIEEKKPKYWVHGHSHDFREWEIGNTKIVRAPLGNAREYINKGRIVNIKEIIL